MTDTLARVQEYRTAALDRARVELREGGAAPVFVGTAIVYDQRTTIGNPASWGWYEEIAPGAASKTLAEADVRMLVDHDSAKVVSRSSAGTLRLADTADGLAVESDLNVAKSYVADLTENLRDGSITGMSFGFYVVKDEWSSETIEATDKNGRATQIEVDVRRITEIRLVEVSAVTFPAYDQTDAGLRSMCAEVRSISFPPASDGDREPAETTRGQIDDEPAEATRSDEAYHQRLRAWAHRTGLPLAALFSDSEKGTEG